MSTDCRGVPSAKLEWDVRGQALAASDCAVFDGPAVELWRMQPVINPTNALGSNGSSERDEDTDAYF